MKSIVQEMNMQNLDTLILENGYVCTPAFMIICCVLWSNVNMPNLLNILKLDRMTDW